MADLLIELVSEEIPARMQNMAAQHFATAVRTALDDLGVWTNDTGIDGLCGPRHLAVYASGIAVAQPDRQGVMASPTRLLHDDARSDTELLRASGVMLRIGEARDGNDHIFTRVQRPWFHCHTRQQALR